jgi:cytochrome P450 PksS
MKADQRPAFVTLSAPASHPVPMEVTDLSDPVMFRNPFPRYAHLRKAAPVSYVKSWQLLKGGRGYLLARHEDVKRIYADDRFSSDHTRHGRFGAKIPRMLNRMFRLLGDSMVMKDDPEHRRLRGLVNKAFTPRMVAGMADDIERLVARLLDEMAAKRHVELVDDFAVPLPLAVISSMLGVGDRDRDRFHMLVKQILQGQGGTALETLRAMPASRQLFGLFENLVERRRREPDDRLISALIRANEDGDQLSDRDILAMSFLLLLAGHDTTASLLSCGVLALLQHPEQLERLRKSPDLIETAVEELLRYTTPVPCGVARIAREDVEIAGLPIPAGSQILGMIISANRDESVFRDPETLDLGRDPNPHIAFAYGAHYCLGSQLARLEARIALRALLARFDHIELEVPVDTLRYKPTQALRGLSKLPLQVY